MQKKKSLPINKSKMKKKKKKINRLAAKINAHSCINKQKNWILLGVKQMSQNLKARQMARRMLWSTFTSCTYTSHPADSYKAKVTWNICFKLQGISLDFEVLFHVNPTLNMLPTTSKQITSLWYRPLVTAMQNNIQESHYSIPFTPMVPSCRCATSQTSFYQFS